VDDGSCQLKHKDDTVGKEKKKKKERKEEKMMTAGFHKAKGKQEDGAHQPPSLEGIPPGPFPLHPCFEIRK